MKLKLSDNLLRGIAGGVAAVAVFNSILLPDTPLNFVLSILLMFLLPGYALTRMLFAHRLEFDVFLLLSIGLSVIVTMLTSLALGLSPLMLSKGTALMALLMITLIALLVDFLRSKENKKYELEFARPTRKDFDPVVTTALVFGVALICVFAYLELTTNPPATTMMYIESDHGDDQFPINTTLGSPVNFSVTIKNGEGHSATFKTELYVNGTIALVSSRNIDNGAQTKVNFTATPNSYGFQQIMVKLYINNAYYGYVAFWTTVV